MRDISIDRFRRDDGSSNQPRNKASINSGIFSVEVNVLEVYRI